LITEQKTNRQALMGTFPIGKESETIAFHITGGISMKTKYALFACCISTVFAACSEQSHELSNRKQEIDKERDAQKQLIDRRANELKEDVQQRTEDSQRSLDADRKQIETQKGEIDNEKRGLQKRAEFLKKDLDQQAQTCKKQVDLNADSAKHRLDEFVHKP
jgi:hypothetical protein